MFLGSHLSLTGFLRGLNPSYVKHFCIVPSLSVVTVTMVWQIWVQNNFMQDWEGQWNRLTGREFLSPLELIKPDGHLGRELTHQFAGFFQL